MFNNVRSVYWDSSLNSITSQNNYKMRRDSKMTKRVYFNGRWWLKITPRWIKGPRPIVTYKEII